MLMERMPNTTKIGQREDRRPLIAGSAISPRYIGTVAKLRPLPIPPKKG